MTAADVTTIVNTVKADLIAWGVAVLGLAVIAAGVQWIKRLLG